MSVSPALSWTNVPMGTVEFALIMNDPEPVQRGSATADILHWLVAKIPARRGGVALERLTDFYAAEHQPDETAAAFFTRVDVARVKALLADLEPMTAETARPEDFIDLAEDHAFAPETMDGECAT